MIYCVLLVVGVVALDLWTKALAETFLAGGSDIPILGDWLRLTLVHNSGAAYNSFSGMRIFLIILAAAMAVGGVIYLFLRGRKKGRFLMTGVSLIVAGGLGNMIDRLLRGYVVDMIDIRILPVFNVADIAITTGCVMLLVYLLFLEGREKPDETGK